MQLYCTTRYQNKTGSDCIVPLFLPILVVTRNLNSGANTDVITY